MTNHQESLLKKELCERPNCDLCEELNNLAEKIQNFGIWNSDIQERFGRLFQH